MLDDLDSNDINFWLAMDRHRTIGDIATIEMIAKLISVVAATRGVQSKFTDWLPWQVDEEFENDPEATLNSMPGGGSAMQAIVDELAEVEAYKQQQREDQNGDRGEP